MATQVATTDTASGPTTTEAITIHLRGTIGLTTTIGQHLITRHTIAIRLNRNISIDITAAMIATTMTIASTTVTMTETAIAAGNTSGRGCALSGSSNLHFWPNDTRSS